METPILPTREDRAPGPQGRPGWHYGVLDEGALCPDNAFERLDWPHPEWTIARVTSPVVGEAEADMGDWRHPAGFVRWAKENYPARRAMLLV